METLQSNLNHGNSSFALSFRSTLQMNWGGSKDDRQPLAVLKGTMQEQDGVEEENGEWMEPARVSTGHRSVFCPLGSEVKRHQKA